MRLHSFSVTACIAGVLIAGLAGRAAAQRPVTLAPDAPPDRPVSAAQACQLQAMLQAMEPYVAQARATYPAARERFARGLPERHTMFVTTRLRDRVGRMEQVFVAVDSIRGPVIAGRIWSPVSVVTGYRYRQPYTFADSLLVDWMVARPDGTEEGNVVGKFLDTYRPPATCADSAAAG